MIFCFWLKNTLFINQIQDLQLADQPLQKILTTLAKSGYNLGTKNTISFFPCSVCNFITTPWVILHIKASDFLPSKEIFCYRDFIIGHIDSSPLISLFTAMESVSKTTLVYPNLERVWMVHFSASASASNAYLNLDSFLAPAHTRFPWWGLSPPIPFHLLPYLLFQAPSMLHLIHVGGGGLHLRSDFSVVVFLTFTFLIFSLFLHSLSSSFALVIVYYDLIVWYLSGYSVYNDLIVRKVFRWFLIEFKFYYNFN